MCFLPGVESRTVWISWEAAAPSNGEDRAVLKRNLPYSRFCIVGDEKIAQVSIRKDEIILNTWNQKICIIKVGSGVISKGVSCENGIIWFFDFWDWLIFIFGAQKKGKSKDLGNRSGKVLLR